MARKLFEAEIGDEDEFVFRLHMPEAKGALPEAKGHFFAAQREMLLALRSLLDVAINRLGDEEKPPVRKSIEVE